MGSGDLTQAVGLAASTFPHSSLLPASQPCFFETVSLINSGLTLLARLADQCELADPPVSAPLPSPPTPLALGLWAHATLLGFTWLWDSNSGSCLTSRCFTHQGIASVPFYLKTEKVVFRKCSVTSFSTGLSLVCGLAVASSSYSCLTSAREEWVNRGGPCLLFSSILGVNSLEKSWQCVCNTKAFLCFILLFPERKVWEQHEMFGYICVQKRAR